MKVAKGVVSIVGFCFWSCSCLGYWGRGGVCFSGNFDYSALGYLFGGSRFVLVHLSIVP